MPPYKGLVFKNQTEPSKPFIIEIAEEIGYDPWYSDADTISTKEQMLAELKTICDTQRDKVIVNINGCLGGDVNHALSIHDLLKTNFKEIETNANGSIASAAVIIFAAGSVRRQSDNALVLIHRASTWGGGNINDFKQACEDLEKFDDRIINIFVKATGKPLADITVLMDANNGNGKWLSPAEAKTSGLTTEIFEPTFKASNKINKTILNRYGYPALPPESDQNTSDKQPKNIFKTVKKMIDKAITQIPPANPTPENTMIKQFLNLNTTLGVDNLESADTKGVYLNEAQLEKISNALQASDLARQTAVDSLATAEAAHTAALKTVTDEKLAAEASLATAITEVDEVDQTVKDAVDLPAKLIAIKDFVAKKPGVQAPGIDGKQDSNSGEANGVKTEVLNALEHQQVASKMFGYDE